MKRNELEVTVRGLTKSGKTSLVSVIAEALNAYGISVTVRDDDPRSIQELQRGAILKGKKVTIRVQTARA